jgi:hypothetical protein
VSELGTATADARLRIPRSDAAFCMRPVRAPDVAAVLSADEKEANSAAGVLATELLAAAASGTYET